MRGLCSALAQFAHNLTTNKPKMSATLYYTPTSCGAASVISALRGGILSDSLKGKTKGGLEFNCLIADIRGKKVVVRDGTSCCVCRAWFGVGIVPASASNAREKNAGAT